MVQLVKNLPATQVTQVRFLGREDPLENEMSTHSSILAWRIPQIEKPGRLRKLFSRIALVRSKLPCSVRASLYQ